MYRNKHPKYPKTFSFKKVKFKQSHKKLVEFYTHRNERGRNVARNVPASCSEAECWEAAVGGGLLGGVGRGRPQQRPACPAPDHWSHLLPKWLIPAFLTMDGGGQRWINPWKLLPEFFWPVKFLGRLGGVPELTNQSELTNYINPLRPEQQWCVIGFEQPHILCCTLLYFAVLSCTVLYFYFVVTPQSNMPPPPTDSEPPTNSEPPILRGSGILLPK